MGGRHLYETFYIWGISEHKKTKKCRSYINADTKQEGHEGELLSDKECKK
jgi:hypothetical protein